MCEGCKKLTRTVFGRCPNCGYTKQPELVPAASATEPSPRPLGELLIDALIDLAWTYPGLAVIVIDLAVLHTGIGLAIGLILLAGAGGLKFGDWF